MAQLLPLWLVFGGENHPSFTPASAARVLGTGLALTGHWLRGLGSSSTDPCSLRNLGDKEVPPASETESGDMGLGKKKQSFSRHATNDEDWCWDGQRDKE